MNAAMRWVVWGTLPLGGLLGGVFGSLFGIRTTIWIAVIGMWAAALWVFFSPLRTLRDIPAEAIPGASGPPDGAAPLSSADAEQREKYEDNRRDGEYAVADDDRDGKVPLGRDG